ncbi:cytoplasm protein [Lichtheimia corymbifera JMRC:FSU:9682]|uniref:Cytoplasm protein n=1 Tax=Lichtheimia corymbifera JMRC:FSU:9682 TaxID=1263082 RepID=A0A068RH20_9FUNG|nr:cytoplasm protein [Lichtheimia corymbifera JMRC:FSU:9682]
MGMQVVLEYYKRQGIALAIRQPAHRWQSLSSSLRTLHEGFQHTTTTTTPPIDTSSSDDNDHYDIREEAAEDDNISLHEDDVHRIRMVPCIDPARNCDQLYIPHRISFRTKVVSRKHAVLWVQRGKFFIRDTKSSSGTYVNNVRLSAPYMESKAKELHDGDILQLGADYRGDSFRCIKLKVELDRKRTHEIDWFSYQSFQSLQYLTSHTPTSTMLGGGIEFGSSASSSASYVMDDEAVYDKEQQQQQHDPSSESLIKDCCICLYPVAPLQALFVAPCQHTFHYKCIRPLLNHYPGFQCPCCRNYSDLESPVTIEKSEVLEMLDRLKNSNSNHSLDICTS